MVQLTRLLRASGDIWIRGTMEHPASKQPFKVSIHQEHFIGIQLAVDEIKIYVMISHFYRPTR